MSKSFYPRQGASTAMGQWPEKKDEKKKKRDNLLLGGRVMSCERLPPPQKETRIRLERERGGGRERKIP